MTDVRQAIDRFCAYARSLAGDEKGEAQVFCDRLFQAFGHAGYKEAGATLEHRVKGRERKVRFADLAWKPRLLLEMKRRGTKLAQHYTQAFEYWLHLVPNRPRYVVLCNFDEFWIYDFDIQLDEPMDRLRLQDLPSRYTALSFLFPEEKRPQFNNNRQEVTDAAARKVAEVFHALLDRGETRERAQRFILQCVVAMFAEDVDLLPRGLFTEIVAECRERRASSYDLLGALFRQMNAPAAARGGRFKGVAYFDGGLFERIEPIDLSQLELELLSQATDENWSRINPAIFGTLFQASMTERDRHRRGAHYTHEADIQRVILPTIVRPWRERIAASSTLKDLLTLRNQLVSFKVLDPACGSGNFLYVAYRELKRLELALLQKIHENFSDEARRRVGASTLVSTRQLYGIDIEPFAVELAKVTLVLGKKLALDEAHHALDAAGISLPLDFDVALPFDNLDETIRKDDALFCSWPKVDAVIGNPPYQSKNNMQRELGAAYVRRVRERYPDVPGRADYCVYWLRRAHDELPEGGRAGLVGTNTIRQNYSRQGGLDYVIKNGGTITEAVSTQVWPGEACVRVSIVNWTKGSVTGKKRLFTQVGDQVDSPWTLEELERIPAALSADIDVTRALSLRQNRDAEACFQGQTHGHEGFLLNQDEVRAFGAQSSRNREVLFPYLTGDDLLTRREGDPFRYVIDFHPRDALQARSYRGLYERIHRTVLPARKEAAEMEARRNEEARAGNSNARVNMHHRNFLKRWWLLSYPREDLIAKLAGLRRYIACSRVTKRPIFEFIDSGVHPSDVVMAFPLTDDYSFGVLQSAVHWAWFTARCSTLGETFRYTSDTVFNSFPWPQRPSVAEVRAVAKAAVALRALRRGLMTQHAMSLRGMYQTLDEPGKHPLKEAHATLDAAVRAAYGMTPQEDPLAFLLAQNEALAAREEAGDPVVGPGLPPCVKGPEAFMSTDCIAAPVL